MMKLKRRDFALTALAPFVLSACGGGGDDPAPAFPTGPKADAVDALKRATHYMDDTVSYQGGYVWSYSPVRLRRWTILPNSTSQA